MNLPSALRYPFVNFAKVFSIVLVMTIAMALFTGLLFNAVDFDGIFAALANWDGVSHLDMPEIAFGGNAIMGLAGILAVAIVSGLWLSGYSVAVLRALMRGERLLPAIELGRDMTDGAYLFVASLAYGLLFVALIVVEVFALGILGQIGFLAGLFGMAAFALTIAAMAVMGWAYFVGMARMAAEGNQRASWQLRYNMGVARQNWKWGAFLLMYMFLLTMLYGVVSSIVDGVFGGLMGAAGMTLSIILYYFFNLMQHFSTQHLIAQYAEAIGIGGGKEKIGETIIV